MTKIRLIAGWALVALLLIFIIVNSRQAEIWFFFGTMNMPIAFVVIFSAGLGAGSVLLLKMIRKQKKEKKD